jgi:hypothetical protein
MIEHERLTLDRPEQLQYVTETWAAQDLRKANVLRLAAAMAPADLADACRAKGNELSDSAWQALLSFPSVHVTRAIAITAIEGTRDYYLRRQQSTASWPEPKPAVFAPPAPFIPARQRLKRKLTTIGGLAGVSYALILRAGTGFQRLLKFPRGH